MKYITCTYLVKMFKIVVLTFNDLVCYVGLKMTD